MAPEQFARLLECIAFWLGLRAHLGRSAHLSERSLAEPISDFAASTGGIGALASEFPHPAWDVRRRGRPRSIDFVFRQHQQNGQILAAIETKWAPCTPWSILDDILRLDLVQAQHRYFILAGTTDAVRTALAQLANTGMGSQEPILQQMFGLNAEGNFSQYSEYSVAISDVEGYTTLSAATKRYVATYITDVAGFPRNEPRVFSRLRIRRFGPLDAGGYRCIGLRLSRVQNSQASSALDWWPDFNENVASELSNFE